MPQGTALGLAALRKACQLARKRAPARMAKNATGMPLHRRAATASPVSAANAGDEQGCGRWSAGMALDSAGARHWKLQHPPVPPTKNRVHMIVRLHGCRQDAKGLATSTRMNRIAAFERFVVR